MFNPPIDPETGRGPSRPRIRESADQPRDNRERALDALGTRLLRAAAKGDREECARVCEESARVTAQYDDGVRYANPGPVLGPLPADEQRLLDAQLDRMSDAMLDPAVIGEVRDEARAILADDWAAEARRDAAAEASARLACPLPIRSTRCRQLPVCGLPDRSRRRFVARTHYTTGNLVGTQGNGADRVIPLNTVHMGTTTLTIYAA